MRWHKVFKWLSIITVISLLAFIASNVNVVENPQGNKTLIIGTIAEAAGTADYVCDGVADNVQFQAALNALPAGGGELVVLSGNYVFAATVTRAIANVTITGVGRASYFAFDGVTDLFTAGGNNWVFCNIRTDAGDIGMGATTGWSWENVTINADYYAYRTPRASTTGADWEIPTGRTATYVVAASDAPAHVKAQADYVCDGTADNVEIQAAIDALPLVVKGGNWQVGEVHLTAGNYDIQASLVHPTGSIYQDITLSGEGILTTMLNWNVGVAGDYILDWTSGTNGFRSYLHLKGIGFYGGTAGTEIGRAFNIESTHLTNAYFDVFVENCYAGFCADPAVNLSGTHFNTFTDFVANSNDGWDIQMSPGVVTSFLDQLYLIHGSVTKIQITDSGIQAFGANLSHVDVTQCASMSVMFSGCYFDPVPAGKVSNIILGSAGQVRNPLISGCAFKMSQTELQAGGFYVDLRNTIGARTIGNSWRPIADGDPATTYINIVSGSYYTNIDEMQYFPYERVTDASAYTVIRGHDTLEQLGGGGGAVPLTTSESGFTIDNLGAVGTWTFTLPASARLGTTFKFIVAAAQQLRVEVSAASEIFIANGTTYTDDGGADGYLVADDEGEFAEFIRVATDKWIVVVIGTWTWVQP